MKRKTIEDCIQYASVKDGYFLDEEYKEIHSKYRWRCKYNHIWQASFNSIKRGSWCPFCAGNSPLNISDAHNLAKKNNGKFLSNKYINSNTKYLWGCEKGHQWLAKYDNVKNGSWCPECANNKKYTIEYCKFLASEKNGQCLSKEYKHKKNKLLWRCSEGHTWKSSLEKIKLGRWCHICSPSKPLSIRDCHNIAKKNNGKFLSPRYLNTNTKYLWECEKGHQWNALLASVKNNDTWCPKCNISKKQQQIIDIIKEEFPDLKIENNFRGFDWLRISKHNKMELDIYVPELRLAIEYDGVQHFYPVQFGGISVEKAKENLKKQKKRDIAKNKIIKENSNYVKHFVRFSYRDEINKKNVLEKIYESLCT